MKFHDINIFCFIIFVFRNIYIMFWYYFISLSLKIDTQKKCMFIRVLHWIKSNRWLNLFSLREIFLHSEIFYNDLLILRNFYFCIIAIWVLCSFWLLCICVLLQIVIEILRYFFFKRKRFEIICLKMKMNCKK